MHSLIIEDDFIQRQVFAQHLAHYGTVAVAGDGDAGLRAGRQARATGQPFDLVLVDIVLPRMDGLAVLAAWRADERAAGIGTGHGSRVIMTTSRDDANTIIESFRQQSDAYLVKPVLRFDLLKQLRDLALIA